MVLLDGASDVGQLAAYAEDGLAICATFSTRSALEEPAVSGGCVNEWGRVCAIDDTGSMPLQWAAAKACCPGRRPAFARAAE